MIKPYSKITTVEMWTDEYISKQMLKYHIDGTNDIASRNKKTIDKTVSFIDSLLKVRSTICDYGCGPGLYTNLLQQKNHKVIGIDVSKNSLEYAKAQNDNVEYKQMDYINETLTEDLDFAMMIYCDFGALPPESQEKVLSNISKSLNDDGMFFFDVMSVNHYDDVEELQSEYEAVDGFYMKGHTTVTTEIVKYPELKILLNHQHAVGEREFEVFNWDKCYTVEEMKYLLESNGFELIDYYSDTMGNKNFLTIR